MTVATVIGAWALGSLLLGLLLGGLFGGRGTKRLDSCCPEGNTVNSRRRNLRRQATLAPARPWWEGSYRPGTGGKEVNPSGVGVFWPAFRRLHLRLYMVGPSGSPQIN